MKLHSLLNGVAFDESVIFGWWIFLITCFFGQIFISNSRGIVQALHDILYLLLFSCDCNHMFALHFFMYRYSDWCRLTTKNSILILYAGVKSHFLSLNRQTIIRCFRFTVILQVGYNITLLRTICFAYSPFIAHGGLFIATNHQWDLLLLRAVFIMMFSSNIFVNLGLCTHWTWLLQLALTFT